MKKNNNKFQYNGWIFLDKPIGISSNRALQKIRKLFNNCKAGYVGTLDPLASGFLPIALGKATRTIKYIESSDKEYLFTIQWGKKTTTGDLEGDLIKSNSLIPNEERIQNNLKKFIGSLKQTPPKFSAIKVSGKRAYELVRKKVDFKLSKRDITIKSFNLVNVIDKSRAIFNVSCSSGTYVRTLAEDLAESLGTYGHLTSLRRLGFGNLDKKLISLDSLISLMHIDNLIKYIKPIDTIFQGVRKIRVLDEEAKFLLDGKSIMLNTDLLNNEKSVRLKNNIAMACFKNDLFVLGKIKKGNFFPKVVMNLNN
ncbi:MAG: tRNA pseudouridine(55) synthase TruB [Rickettsiales bacterium]|nr:tRNA pseudouridine(55) synthase TruB [Rickettsiales bacterium]OUV54035.1 MAG: tRNA pseudouridine(55) synthase TruB [Rickettsiales bacterium TMED127]|tara:strand:- start:46405 stop:47334 length:930 start_codon:yes stop_codon:yes gene_type:complete